MRSLGLRMRSLHRPRSRCRRMCCRVVLRRSLTRRRRTCLPCLLLRLRRRTRRWSVTLRLVRMRWNILWRRLRNRPIVCCVGVRRWGRLLLRSLLSRSVIRLRRRARAIVGRRMRYLRVVVRLRNVVVGASLLITVLRRRLRDAVLRRRLWNISILRSARLRAIVLLRSRSITIVGLRRIIGLSRPVHCR